MRINKSGATRWVFFIGKYAIKIPSLYDWKHFLWGLLGNLNEIQFSKISDAEFKDKLCPIKFYIPGGFLIAMLKADKLSTADINQFNAAEFCTLKNGYMIPAEFKTDSFGKLNNKIVCIDYGDYYTYIK